MFFQIFSLLFLIRSILSEKYEVSCVKCAYGDEKMEKHFPEKGYMTAVLRNPPNFSGTPIFADKKSKNNDPDCQIISQNEDKTLFQLLVLDLESCGALNEKDYFEIRIWFTKMKGLIMASDQEVTIRCKPEKSSAQREKIESFSDKKYLLNNTKLKCVNFFSRNPSITERIFFTPSDTLKYRIFSGKGILQRSNQLGSATSGNQKVAIGSKLLISAYKFVTIYEITISSLRNNPYYPGYVTLVSKGCRNKEFMFIAPRNPYWPQNATNIVNFEFEAFSLNGNFGKNNWIHVVLKTCVMKKECDSSC